MTMPIIIVVTGASGSGKTATVRALAARELPGVHCHYFDAIGVPSNEDMRREFGSPEQWQAITTRRWLDRLSVDGSDTEVHVLEGQTRPSFVRDAAEHVRIGMRVKVRVNQSAEGDDGPYPVFDPVENA